MGNPNREKSKIDKRTRQRARIGNCIKCKKSFRAVKDFKERKQKYCSKDCWNVRARKINHCLNCGKEVTTHISVNKKYCNQKCRDIHYRIRLKGEKSHFWQGGKTSRNKLLRTNSQFREWRKAVFERDNYTCQECNARSGKDKKVYLHPHHKKELSKYPKQVYIVSNGQTLCSECHQKKHKQKLSR